MIQVNDSDGDVTITLDKTFDFNSVEDFRKAYTNLKGKSYVVDFRETEYMDSSGLGMLLNMRRHLGDNSAMITLSNCRAQIKKVLIISRFEQKFTLR